MNIATALILFRFVSLLGETSATTCHRIRTRPNAELLNWQFRWAAGETARFRCAYGSKLDRRYSLTATCLGNGKWSNDSPRCTRILCPEIETNSNSEMIYPSLRLHLGWYVGQKVRYWCDDGYTTVEGYPQKEIECLLSGQWNDEPPTCIEKPHCTHNYHITSKDQIILLNPERQYQVGSKILIACKLGYVLTGPSEILCTSNHTWNSELPKCIPISCGNFPVISGSVDPPQGPFRLEDVVNVSCSADLFLHGPRQVKCQWDGTWSEIPRCLERSTTCKHPPTAPENGFMEKRDGKITFSCDKVFCIKGDSEMNCLSDGTWYGKPPICEVCPDAMENLNGVQYLAFTRKEVESNYDHAQKYCHQFGGNLAVLFDTRYILRLLNWNLLDQLEDYGSMYIAYKRMESDSTEYNWDIANITIPFPYNWEVGLSTGWQEGKPELGPDKCVVMQYNSQRQLSSNMSRPHVQNGWTNVDCNSKAGFLCQRRTDYCSPNPCQNGGSCRESSRDYFRTHHCICSALFYGPNCVNGVTCNFRPFDWKGFRPMYKDSFPVGDVIPLRCNGQQRGGPPQTETICQAGSGIRGSWTNERNYCIEKECPRPKLPRSMKLSDDRGFNRIGRIRHIRCTEGKINGRDWIQCQSSMNWTLIGGFCLGEE